MHYMKAVYLLTVDYELFFLCGLSIFMHLQPIVSIYLTLLKHMFLVLTCIMDLFENLKKHKLIIERHTNMFQVNKLQTRI